MIVNEQAIRLRIASQLSIGDFYTISEDVFAIVLGCVQAAYADAALATQNYFRIRQYAPSQLSISFLQSLEQRWRTRDDSSQTEKI